MRDAHSCYIATDNNKKKGRKEEEEDEEVRTACQDVDVMHDR